jgi:hypothetical protein
VKVTVATRFKEGFVVGMRSMPGNPYGGHTLEEALELVSILAERTPKDCDRGSWISGRRPGCHSNPTIGTEARH